MSPTVGRLLVAAAVATAAGCGSDRSATASPGERRSPAETPREVQVIAASEIRSPRVITVTGTLAAEERVVLSLKVTGLLAQLSVDLGSRVRRGERIARLDDEDFRLRVRQAEAALQQARARLGLAPDGTDDRVDPEQTALVRQAVAVLEEARLTRERMTQLWEQQFVARAQLDAAVSAEQVAEGRYDDALQEVRNRQAVLAQRRAELALARQQLADAVLVSPIDGAVSERQASVGQYLEAGTPIATVVRVHPLRLRVAVPEREATGLRVGQPVRVAVDGDPATYGGRVARLSPAIQEQSRTLLVEAEVPNADGRLRPGAFAKAEIVTATDQPTIVVPASAIVTFAGIEKVITVVDGRTVERRVETGRREGERVEVSAGLAVGDMVVVRPGNLVGGQQVVVTP